MPFTYKYVNNYQILFMLTDFYAFLNIFINSLHIKLLREHRAFHLAMGGTKNTCRCLILISLT